MREGSEVRQPQLRNWQALSGNDCHDREAFKHVVDCSLLLVQYLCEAGPDKVHNMDSLLLHESMDIIGARHACSPPHAWPSCVHTAA